MTDTRRAGMRGLLVRVAADQTAAGGQWNGPCNAESREFVYVPIIEQRSLLPGLETPFATLRESLSRFGGHLPTHIADRYAHLDPDFANLTYGDRGARGSQIAGKIGSGDLLVFYAGLRDILSGGIRYALIGLYEVDRIVRAIDLPDDQRYVNAHSRREPRGETDIIVFGRPGTSGRFSRYIEFGEYRDRAYRVRPDLLQEWGGISSRDGYVQRSVRLPELLAPNLFMEWFDRQGVELIANNN